MRRNVISAIVFALLFTGMLTLAFGVQMGKSIVRLITVPDDFPTIQAAIDAAIEGDTIFVRNGTYYEHITIDKPISLVGENRNASIVDGSQNGTVISIIADYVNVSRLTIRNGYYVPHINYGIKIGEWDHGCKSVSVCENTMSANDIGVLVYCSNKVAVSNNTFFGNYIGLEIVLSSENYVEGNNLVNNWMGIGIGSDANSNVVIDNEISNSDFGVQVGWSTDNKIVGNTISLSTSSGIRFDASHNNSITGNTITSCNREGIVLFGSNSNIITMNKLVQNNWDGIAVWYSNANLICHNNFETNAKHAGSYAGSINTWDDGYPSGGNYWSNYIGTDADNDGIGDLPYVIDADNRDRYPLMKPFGTPIKGDVDSNGMVDINDVIVWTNAFGSQPQDPDWNPYTDLHADGVIDIFDAVVIATNFGRTHA